MRGRSRVFAHGVRVTVVAWCAPPASLALQPSRYLILCACSHWTRHVCSVPVDKQVMGRQLGLVGMPQCACLVCPVQSMQRMRYR